MVEKRQVYERVIGPPVALFGRASLKVHDVFGR